MFADIGLMWILINLVAKHKSGELRCPATALILYLVSIFVLFEHYVCVFLNSFS